MCYPSDFLAVTLGMWSKSQMWKLRVLERKVIFQAIELSLKSLGLFSALHCLQPEESKTSLSPALPFHITGSQTFRWASWSGRQLRVQPHPPDHGAREKKDNKISWLVDVTSSPDVPLRRGHVTQFWPMTCDAGLWLGFLGDLFKRNRPADLSLFQPET